MTFVDRVRFHSETVDQPVVPQGGEDTMCNKDSRTTLLSGVDSLPWLVMTWLLFVSLSCTVTPEIAPALKLDERYAKEIVFDVIGLTIPLDEHQFIRSDGAVDDMDAHTEQLISELGLEHAQ